MSIVSLKKTGLAVGLVFGIIACAALVLTPGKPMTQTYIVQGHDLAELKVAIEAIGGEITHELGIINAVGVELGVVAALPHRLELVLADLHELLGGSNLDFATLRLDSWGRIGFDRIG